MAAVLSFLLKGHFLYAPILYDNFFPMVSAINASKSAAKNGNKSSNKARYQLSLIQALYFAYTLFALAQLPFFHLFSSTLQFCLCNWFYFEGLSPVHWGWLIVNSYMLIYFNHLMYFHNAGATFQVLEKMYQRINSHQNSNSIEDFFVQSSHRLILQKNVVVVAFITQKLLPLARAYTIAFNGFLSFLILVFWAILHGKAAQLGLLDQPYASLVYCSFIAFGIFYTFLTRVFQELIMTHGFHTVLLCYVFTVKLQQIFDHLRTGKLVFFSELRLRLHLRYNADSLVFLTDFNRLYGRALFCLFLVIYPENAANWIGCLKMLRWRQEKRALLSPLVEYFLYYLAIFIFLVLKVVHYRAVLLTRRLYSSAKYLHAVAVHSKSIQDPKIRLKLERTICLFYSAERPHTVTYGRHGNMSKASFGKSIFYYFKLLLFVNKLFS